MSVETERKKLKKISTFFDFFQKKVYIIYRNKFGNKTPFTLQNYKLFFNYQINFIFFILAERIISSLITIFYPLLARN